MDESKIADTLINIGCVLVGFLLSTGKEWFDKRSTQVEARKSLRCLVSLELQTALSTIELFWQQVLQKEERWRTVKGEINIHELGQTIAQLPFPKIATSVWQTSISQFPDAYSDTEIKELWGLYNDLFLLSNLQQHFSESLSDIRAVPQGTPRGSGITQSVFRQFAFTSRTGDNVEIFKSTTEGLIAKSHSGSAVISARKK